MYFLLHLSHYVKSYGHLCQILTPFTMPAPQIWPCHVTQEANFEKKFYFFLIVHLILGKVTKFLVEKLSTSEVISQKPHGGGCKTSPPPVLLGLISICREWASKDKINYRSERNIPRNGKWP